MSPPNPKKRPASSMSTNAEDSTANSATKKVLHRGSFDAIVDIRVGPNTKVFSIHKQLLCEVSPYFEAALKGQFIEAEKQSIEFVEESVTMFEHFQLWLYSGNILAPHESAKDIGSSTLYDLYAFGEMRHIPRLQNAVMDVFFDRNIMTNTISISLLHRVYQDLPNESPLRKLFIDWFTYGPTLTDDKWFSDRSKEQYPKDFLCDLAQSLYAKGVGTKPKTMDFTTLRSNYYVNAPAQSSTREDTGKRKA